MDLDTPIPVMPDRFWASETNKTNTQLLLRDTQTPPHIDFVFSSIIQNGELLNARVGNQDILEPNNWIEEADNKVVGHIKYAITVQKGTRIITLSNDTDTFIVLLSYMEEFSSMGLKELWIQYGTGDHRRMIPVHEAYNVSGPALSKAIMKSYIITGNDYPSKIHRHKACSLVLQS